MRERERERESGKAPKTLTCVDIHRAAESYTV